MKRSAELYINDILENIDDIKSFTKGITEEEFHINKEKQKAVIRSYEIIGEAANKILQEFIELTKKYENVPWRDISNFRNILIHEYPKLSLKKIWDITKYDLSDLEKKVKIIKEKEFSSDK